jgi:hypothetical protein
VSFSTTYLLVSHESFDADKIAARLKRFPVPVDVFAVGAHVAVWCAPPGVPRHRVDLDFWMEQLWERVAPLTAPEGPVWRQVEADEAFFGADLVAGLAAALSASIPYPVLMVGRYDRAGYAYAIEWRAGDVTQALLARERDDGVHVEIDGLGRPSEHAEAGKPLAALIDERIMAFVSDSVTHFAEIARVHADLCPPSRVGWAEADRKLSEPPTMLACAKCGKALARREGYWTAQGQVCNACAER